MTIFPMTRADGNCYTSFTLQFLPALFYFSPVKNNCMHTPTDNFSGDLARKNLNFCLLFLFVCDFCVSVLTGIAEATSYLKLQNKLVFNYLISKYSSSDIITRGTSSG